MSMMPVSAVIVLSGTILQLLTVIHARESGHALSNPWVNARDFLECILDERSHYLYVVTGCYKINRPNWIV